MLKSDRSRSNPTIAVPVSPSDAALLRRISRIAARDRVFDNYDEEGRAGLARLADHGLIELVDNLVQLTQEARFSIEPTFRLGPLGVRWPLDHPRAQAC